MRKIAKCFKISILILGVSFILVGCANTSEMAKKDTEVETLTKKVSELENIVDTSLKKVSEKELEVTQKDEKINDFIKELEKAKQEFDSINQENVVLREANRELSYYKQLTDFSELKASYQKWLEEQEYIINFVKIYDVSIRKVNEELTSDSGINFKIRNNGMRDLKDIEVVVYYLDSNNKPIYENSYNPLADMATTTENQNKILKSGYIWESKKQYLFMDNMVPSEWNGEVNVEIKNIKFN